MAIFTIGTTDCSSNVVAESYNINRLPVYKEWTDAGNYTHRDIVGYKIQGSMVMYFDTPTALQTFVTLVENSKRSDGTVAVAIKCNNYQVANQTAAYVYIDFSPTRKLSGALADTFDTIEVTIKEK